jgi:hypothetical protein
MLSGYELVFAGLAAVAAGCINAIAGGGTLISFPALVALGIPEVTANITNTVALCPGYLGGALAQRKDLTGQGRRLWILLPAGIAGGIIGAILLLFISGDVFRVLVPFLILLAVALLAVQNRVRNWLRERSARIGGTRGDDRKAILPLGLAAVYGGYFGAGLSVIVLSVLGLVFDDSLTRLNALKQCLSLVINVAATIFFLFSGMVLWPVVLVMAVGALAGGAIGGRVAGCINPDLLRWTVVTIGGAIGIYLLVSL